MPRWKELPAELDPRVHQLVVRLRRLKDRSGLSMRQLAAKTGYSEKSWERYLNGRSLPPVDAVEAMARTGGDDVTRLLALHEVATEAWSTKTRETQETQETRNALEEEPQPPARSLRTMLVAGAVALVLIASASVLAVVRLQDGDGSTTASHRASPTTSASTSTSASVSASRITYTCRMERIDGHWYSGNSRTQDAILAGGQAGPEVAEAQCLLRRAGIAPGTVDGIFGPLTQRAVERIQKRDELVVDGIIGPHTWKALRSDARAPRK